MLSRLERFLTAAAAVVLAGLFLVPIWRIQLIAPQYPEGLGMRIWLTALRGASPNDLDNINELNHYIGMKLITTSAIPELRVMPWIVAVLVVLGLIVALVGRRGGLYAWVAAFTAFGAAGLVDFWRWEYDYGHHIDYDDAIIKVPGMVYQPPLLGSKQLLNFTATSWPDVGGWLALLAFVLAATAVLLTLRRAADRRHRVGLPIVSATQAA
jgi:hypothetical protein